MIFPRLSPSSVTADIEGVSDKMIVAAKYGFALLDKQTGALSYIQKGWADSEKAARYLCSPSTPQSLAY